MGGAERLGELARDLDRVAERKLPLTLQALAQRAALHEWQHDVEMAVGRARVEQAQHARVVEAAVVPHFADEAVGTERFDEFVPEHLHGHRARLDRIDGAIDDSRGPAPDLGFDQVPVGEQSREHVFDHGHGRPLSPTLPTMHRASAGNNSPAPARRI